MTDTFAKSLLFACVLTGTMVAGCGKTAATATQAQGASGGATSAPAKTLDQQIQDVQRSSDIPPAAKAQVIERLRREHAGGTAPASGS